MGLSGRAAAAVNVAARAEAGDAKASAQAKKQRADQAPLESLSLGLMLRGVGRYRRREDRLPARTPPTRRK